MDDLAQEQEAAILGLIRRGQRMPGMARRVVIREGDLLVLESRPKGLDKLVGELGLEYVRPQKDQKVITGDDLDGGKHCSNRAGFFSRSGLGDSDRGCGDPGYSLGVAIAPVRMSEINRRNCSIAQELLICFIDRPLRVNADPRSRTSTDER